MITLKDLYTVLSAMVPLYAAMILAYGSVRWWKIFTPAQCAGINRFVAVFAVPLLSFHFISSNNPYTMDGPFILADTASKLAILAALAAWTKLSRAGSLDWMITLFSLSTLPNTLVMGIPLLDAMYGPFYGGLMVQLVVLQCIIWYTLMLFLFEYRAARLLVMEQFPDTAGSIVSFKVESDVVSLDGRGGEPLQTQAEVGDDGKIHVTIRRSTSSHSHAFASPYTRSMPSSKAITPRPSNLTGTDVYSVNHGINNPTSDKQSLISTRPVSPRHSNFTTSEEVYSLPSSRGPTPRASNFNEDGYQDFHPSTKAFNSTSPRLHTQPPIPTPPPHSSRNIIGQNGLSIPESRTPLPNGNAGRAHSPKALQICKKIADPRASPRLEDDAKELHMFVWSSTNSPMSDRGFHMFGGSDYGLANEPMEVRLHVLPSSCDRIPNGDGNETMPPQGPVLTNEFSFGSKSRVIEDPGSPVDKFPQNIPKSSSVTQYSPKAPGGGENPRGRQPPPTVMLKLILRMVGRKLLHNPNTYSSVIGLTWALIAFRWNIEMPTIVSNSIKILSDAGLGMAMFSLGLFMALQPRLIACGTPLAVFAMAVRFLTGPAIMSAASIAVGLRKVDLHAAIVQAALPQGIVPFVFAREYDLHPDILSTAVIFGMLIALPITLVYYILLGL